MPFAWFSDDFYDHPKVRALPRRYRNEAAGLFVRLVTLCNRHLTDGVVTEADIEACDGNDRLVDLLLEVPHGFRAGLLERRRGKLRIHDFHAYSKTKRQVVADREKKVEAGRKGGIASGKQRRSKSAGKRPSRNEAGASRVVEPRTPSHTDTESSLVPTPTGEPRLTAEQLATWEDFSHPGWGPFRQAWHARGLLLAPHGAWDDPMSQRAVLWEVADAMPDALGRWVREAPTNDAHGIVGYVLERWREAKAEGRKRAEAQEAESARHKGSRGADAAAMTRLGTLLPGGAR